MSTPSNTSTGLSIADLKTLIRRDLENSNALQGRIEQLREDMKAGKKPAEKKLDLMMHSNKDMTKDLVSCIEKIEGSAVTATDREMLQALYARLAVCDLQASRLAELRELEVELLGQSAGSQTTESLVMLPALQPTRSMPATAEPGDHGKDTNEVAQPCSLSRRHSESELADYEDREGWKLPYRVLGIPPDTANEDIEELVIKAMTSLAIKHDPSCRPNDPAASERWAIIERSRDVLTHTGRRQFMDDHDRLPADLRDVDLERLHMGR